jgi:sec-independent protein translocase protein TatB
MFDIGWSELLVIGVVALIAIGPKELPGVLRTVGQWMGKVRRMAGELQGQFQEAMREAEMADIKKQVDEMSSAASNFTNFDPIGTVRKEIESLSGDPLGSSTAKPADTAIDAAAASPEAAVPSTPVPVLPDFSAPQPSPPLSDLAPEAPLPPPPSNPNTNPNPTSSGSGA